MKDDDPYAVVLLRAWAIATVLFLVVGFWMVATPFFLIGVVSAILLISLVIGVLLTPRLWLTNRGEGQ